MPVPPLTPLKAGYGDPHAREAGQGEYPRSVRALTENPGPLGYV